MKTSLLSAVLLLCMSGCMLHEYELISGKPRDRTFNREQHGKDGHADRPAVPAPDTSVYFCAVRFRDGYAWQRDTAYGSEPYELLLWKDGVQVLGISSQNSSCTSPDHDTHHIISGHLYTERSDLSETSIGRDGEVVASFQGREFLVGLLPDGDDIYTLSQRRDGSGFSFRRNGEVLLAKDGATAFGSMVNPSYGPTGALYMDAGEICFCYHSGKGVLRRYYCVRGGVEEDVAVPEGRDIHDMKSVDGKVHLATVDISGYYTMNCNIWAPGGSVVTAGYMGYGSSTFTGIYDMTAGRLLRVQNGEAEIYCTEGGWWTVTAIDGGIRIRSSGTEDRTETDCYFLSPACAVTAGDRLVYAVSPRQEGAFPKILTGGSMQEVKVHGFISRVAVEISPAS